MKLTSLLAIACLVLIRTSVESAPLFTDVTAACGIKVNVAKRPGQS